MNPSPCLRWLTCCASSSNLSLLTRCMQLNCERLGRNMSSLDHKYRQRRVFVRIVPAEEYVELTLRYSKSTVLIKPRIFNFKRLKTEPLGRTLERMAFNLNAKMSHKDRQHAKKLKCSSSPPESIPESPEEESLLRLVLECGGARILPDIPNDKAWRENTQLFVNETEFLVDVNPPTITEAKITGVILPDFPVDLSLLTEFSNEDESIFVWLKQATGSKKEMSINEDIMKDHRIPISVTLLLEIVNDQLQSKGNWEIVSLNRDWIPKKGDAGSMVGLVCIPLNGPRIGNPVTAFGKNPVASPIEEPIPFLRRHSFCTERCGYGKFRVVSYNLLADLYADQESSLKNLFPYCPPEYIKTEFRRQLMLVELIGYNADIICLQEVDTKIFERFFQPQLARKGYQGLFKQKSGKVLEGVATFFRSDKFALLSQHDIGLSEALFELPAHSQLAGLVKSKSKLNEVMMERKNPLQVTVLQSNEQPSRILVVANTHLWFRPQFPHVRLLQIGVAVKHLEKIMSELREKDPSCCPSIILCGDFNSTAGWGVHRFLNTGQIPEDFPEWKMYCTEDDEYIQADLRHSFNLYSACGELPYTNFVPGFQAAIDWIYADKDALETVSVIPLPTVKELTRFIAIPSQVFPSDHIAIGCDLQWKK